jgi:hypothetical protein
MYIVVEEGPEVRPMNNFNKPKRKHELSIVNNREVLENMNKNILKEQDALRKIKFIDADNLQELTRQQFKNLPHIRYIPKKCPIGEVINPYTERCMKLSSFFDLIDKRLKSRHIDPAILKLPCPAGKVRNPYTGNCIKIETYNTLFPNNKIHVAKKIKAQLVNPKVEARKKRMLKGEERTYR